MTAIKDKIVRLTWLSIGTLLKSRIIPSQTYLNEIMNDNNIPIRLKGLNYLITEKQIAIYTLKRTTKIHGRIFPSNLNLRETKIRRLNIYCIY